MWRAATRLDENFGGPTMNRRLFEALRRLRGYGWAMDRILVTGGAGFIGSHVVDALDAAGLAVRIFDAKQSPHHASNEFDSVRGDLGDQRALEAAMRDCRAVVHRAPAADVGEVVADPMEAERRNTRGTLHVLEAARRAGVARVVYASTIWVYSDVEEDEVD